MTGRKEIPIYELVVTFKCYVCLLFNKITIQTKINLSLLFALMPSVDYII